MRKCEDLELESSELKMWHMKFLTEIKIHPEYGLFALNKTYSEQISSEKFFLIWISYSEIALNKDFSEHFTLNRILFRDYTKFMLSLMYIQRLNLNK